MNCVNLSPEFGMMQDPVGSIEPSIKGKHVHKEIDNKISGCESVSLIVSIIRHQWVKLPHPNDSIDDNVEQRLDAVFDLSLHHSLAIFVHWGRIYVLKK